MWACAGVCRCETHLSPSKDCSCEVQFFVVSFSQKLLWILGFLEFWMEEVNYLVWIRNDISNCNLFSDSNSCKAVNSNQCDIFFICIILNIHEVTCPFILCICDSLAKVEPTSMSTSFKGCVCYIFASSFFNSKRELLWN